MEHMGIDVHKRESQICILTEDGELIERRVRTVAERFAEVLGPRPRARILLEASTEQWGRVESRLVIVADRTAPMCHAHTEVKTDRQMRARRGDQRAGAYQPAHRLSDGQRLRALAVRIRWWTRTGIMVSRALLRQHNYVVPSGGPRRSAGGWSPGWAVLSSGAPVGADADGQRPARVLRRGDRARQRAGPVSRVRTAPSIGPVTAAAFVATLDEATRFRRAHQVEAYLGLVPGEWSTGDGQRRGRITKTGNTRMRWLLIQAALSIMRLRDPRAAGLRAWARSRPGGAGGGVGPPGPDFAMLRDEPSMIPSAGRAGRQRDDSA
jgi:hypothetical protein